MILLRIPLILFLYMCGFSMTVPSHSSEDERSIQMLPLTGSHSKNYATMSFIPSKMSINSAQNTYEELEQESEDSSDNDSFDIINIGPESINDALPIDPLGLVTDVWALICNHLFQGDMVNLAYTSKYFYQYISPICQLDPLSMALQEYSVLPEMSKLRSAFSQRMLAQRLAYVADITKRLQEIPQKAKLISRAPLMVKGIIDSCQKEIKDLLLKGDGLQFSPTFILAGGRKNREFLEGVYGHRGHYNRFNHVVNALLDPIVMALNVCLVSGIMATSILVLNQQYLNKYSYSYNEYLHMNFQPSQRTGCYSELDDLYFYNQFNNYCFQTNASCYLGTYNRSTNSYPLIEGNWTQWQDWMVNKYPLNRTFLEHYMHNMSNATSNWWHQVFKCTPDPNRTSVKCIGGGWKNNRTQVDLIVAQGDPACYAQQQANYFWRRNEGNWIFGLFFAMLDVAFYCFFAYSAGSAQ